MRRFTTIMCSLAFMISGFLISFMKSNNQNQLHAAQSTPIILSRGALPLDFQLNLEKKDRIVEKTDTVILHDTVQVVKYKTKYRAQKKLVEPDSLLAPAKPDTLYVPELRILIQMSEDVLMDSTFIIRRVGNGCPVIQPLREYKE